MISSRKEEFVDFIKTLQQHICDSFLENQEPTATFLVDNWERDTFGYGSTRVLKDGEVLEKAGVNISVVGGSLPSSLQEKFETPESDFSALDIFGHPSQKSILPNGAC